MYLLSLYVLDAPKECNKNMKLQSSALRPILTTSTNLEGCTRTWECQNVASGQNWCRATIYVATRVPRKNYDEERQEAIQRIGEWMEKYGEMLHCQNENIDCWSDETLVWKQNCHKYFAMLQGNFLLPKQNRAGGGLTNVSPCTVSVICNVVAFKQHGGLRRFVFFAKF